MKYVTAEQYKDLDEGTSLDLTDLALTRLIARAETAVDAHMKFRLGIGGFEPHNVWIQERWDGSLQTRFPSYPVPVQKINRYRVQVSNISDGNGFFAGVNTADVIINQREGYVEIVAQESLTYSVIGELLMALKDPIVQMDCFVSFYIPSFGEQLINTGDNKLYKAIRGFWASTNNQALHLTPNQALPIPPVIYVNGIATSSSNYTVDYTEGSVNFTSVQSGTAKISADYVATIPEPAREATIRQTTYLLTQRSLRKSGMSGIVRMKNADQEVTLASSDTNRAIGRGVDVLCDEARNCLACYEEIPVA